MTKKNDDRILSPWEELIDFKAFTGNLATKDADMDPKRPMVYATGSSELEDMAGDRMLVSALEDMKKFSVGSAVFMNHRYSVPEDIFGGIRVPPELTRMQQAPRSGLSKADRPYYAVGFAVNVATKNSRAMDSFGLISVDEIDLGVSIGCEITDYDIRTDDEGLPLGLDIAHLRTLEFSVVGIPCNTESWIQNWAEKGYEGLIKRYAKIPTIKNTSDLIYVAKSFGDFDGITGLYLRRVHDSPKFAYVVNNFDEIKERHGDSVAKLFKTINVPLMKHGYCIAELPRRNNDNRNSE